SEAGETSMRNPLRALVNLRHLARLDVADADPRHVIDERDLLAVGRPLRRVTIAGTEGCQFSLRTGPIRRTEGQFVLAAAIAPVCERLSIGRPARVTLRDA